MARIAYVNGSYVPLTEAAISIRDRGFQFADGVYEVCALKDGRLLDFNAHRERLMRSLDALQIAAPMSDAALIGVIRETLRRNRLRDGLVYLQITRGSAARDHAFPILPTRASLVVTVGPVSWSAQIARARQGIRVRTEPDLRWKRCDIKSISLLANVLAKQSARVAGAAEAWLVDEAGFVTEGASSTAWIVDRHGVFTTRPLDHRILAGVTRSALVAIISRTNLAFEERAFSVSEAYEAQEAFISSATNLVMPVTQIDDRVIGNGRPGALTEQLIAAYPRDINAL